MHSQMIPQEVVKDISDTCEGDLLIGHWLNGGDGEVRVAAWLPAKNCPGHSMAPKNHHPLESMMDE